MEILSEGNSAAKCLCTFIEGSYNLQLLMYALVIKILPMLNICQGILGILWEHQIFLVKKKVEKYLHSPSELFLLKLREKSIQ